VRRGEVRWHKFRSSHKRRPVLILTRDSILEYLGEVTVAPITSTIRGAPSEVILSPADGLTKDCAVNLDHLQTVAQSKLGSLIMTLTEEKMLSVRNHCCLLWASDLLLDCALS
jgi:mRNA interferase MazF